MSTDESKRPPRAFYVITPVLSVIITVLLIDSFFALASPAPLSIERNLCFENDPYTGFRHKPGSTGYYQNNIPAVVNENGHRDDPVTLVKPEDVFRVLVLGDSFTVGANVRQEEAYPQQLEWMLAADLN